MTEFGYFAAVVAWLALWYHFSLRRRMRALSALGIQRSDATQLRLLGIEAVSLACALVFPLLLLLFGLPLSTDPLWIMPMAIYATTSSLLVFARIPEAAPDIALRGLADLRAHPYLRWGSAVFAGFSLALSLALAAYFFYGTLMQRIQP